VVALQEEVEKLKEAAERESRQIGRLTRWLDAFALAADRGLTTSPGPPLLATRRGFSVSSMALPPPPHQPEGSTPRRFTRAASMFASPRNAPTADGKADGPAAPLPAKPAASVRGTSDSGHLGDPPEVLASRSTSDPVSEGRSEAADWDSSERVMRRFGASKADSGARPNSLAAGISGTARLFGLHPDPSADDAAPPLFGTSGSPSNGPPQETGPSAGGAFGKVWPHALAPPVAAAAEEPAPGGQTLEEEIEQFAAAEGEGYQRFARRCNQLCVSVLAARDLKGADLTGYSDPYVSVSVQGGRRAGRLLRTRVGAFFGNAFRPASASAAPSTAPSTAPSAAASGSGSGSGGSGGDPKRLGRPVNPPPAAAAAADAEVWHERNTYFMRQNLNPKWEGADFVFDLPPDALKHARKYTLRFRVRDNHFLQRGDFLGQVEVPLSKLDSEEVRCPARGRGEGGGRVVKPEQWSKSSLGHRVGCVWVGHVVVERILFKKHADDIKNH
jgi:hypothetical protein